MKNRSIDVQIDQSMEKWIDRQVDRSMIDGWMHGWIDGWRQTDRKNLIEQNRTEQTRTEQNRQIDTCACVCTTCQYISICEYFGQVETHSDRCPPLWLKFVSTMDLGYGAAVGHLDVDFWLNLGYRCIVMYIYITCIYIFIYVYISYVYIHTNMLILFLYIYIYIFVVCSRKRSYTNQFD